MFTKKKTTPERTHRTDAGAVYYVEEKDGRYYVYYLQVAPVKTLFDIARTREHAEQAIKDHKEGKHSTQVEY